MKSSVSQLLWAVAEHRELTTSGLPRIVAAFCTKREAIDYAKECFGSRWGDQVDIVRLEVDMVRWESEQAKS